VLSCSTTNLTLPDQSSTDILDLTTFGITSNTSSALTVTSGISSTVITMYVYSRNVTITIPNNISINLASTPTSANCSNDIGAGYYPSLSQCIYICPCNTKGLFCNFTDASVTSTALPTTTNQFCGSYSFESTPKTTTLNPTYQLSSTTDVPHYKVTGYSGSDVLTIWADLTVVQYTVLLLSRLNKICSPNITGEGMYVNQTIQHYAPTI
jgi:hypothetical protein